VLAAITVDPAGDTRASVRIFVRQHQAAGEDRVAHTLYTPLLDKSLRGRVIYDSTATVSDVVHDVRLLLGSAR
jgi:hypothetical protein